MLLTGCLLLLMAGNASAKSIRLRNAIISPPAAKVATTNLAGAIPQSVSGLYLIQFSGPVQPEWRQQLANMGVELLVYVPDDAFVARLRQTSLPALRQFSFVHWVGTYDATYRLHPDLQATSRKPHLTAVSIPVNVILAAGLSAAEWQAVERLFATPVHAASWRFGSVLCGSIPISQLATLAAMDDVLWVEPAGKFKLHDETVAKIVGGDGGVHRTLTQALGYDGTNILVAVADSGLDTGDTNTLSLDLRGRVQGLVAYGSETNAADGFGHGTHVAGILAGNGAIGETDADGNLYGLGMAPGSELLVQKIFDDYGNYVGPADPDLEQLTRDATEAGAVIGVNSWGVAGAGDYTIAAAVYDGLVRDADSTVTNDQPFILEFSVGNDGPFAQSIESPASAKNVISTGASQSSRTNFTQYTDGPEAMANFSSRGPCADGRIKPDVVAPGTWVASLMSAAYMGGLSDATPISSNYMYLSGTSQAGPLVGGAAAVFVQYYRQTHANVTPSPALLKAALINSAHDLDNNLDTAPVPNMDEGWGRVDLPALLASSRIYDFTDQSVLLATGQSYERKIIVTSSNLNLKVTLAYTDVPGFPGAAQALVNDLDLEVVAPDGHIYRGNQFDVAGNSVPDPPATDTLNNVEGVNLAAPMPGEYTFRVVAHSVSADARLDTPAVDQDFALVISGALPTATSSIVLLDHPTYTAPGWLGLHVLDAGRAGSNSVHVLLQSTTESTPENIVLPAADAAGNFTGRVATATGPATVDGKLQIANGDVILATYMDAWGSNKTATATADLQPPVLTGVTVTNAFGRMNISWNSDEPATTVLRYGPDAGMATTVSNATRSLTHTITLEDLTAGQKYYFELQGADAAGNVTTNNQGGTLFSFVAVPPAVVLLVDSYIPDNQSTNIPLSTYTEALDQAGYNYDVWRVLDRDTPPPDILESYRVVIWRVSDSLYAPLLHSTFTTQEQTNIQNYVAGGGSFFVASMEILSRLGDIPFRANLLHVGNYIANPDIYSPCPTCDQNHGVPEVLGITNDSLTAGVDMTLDYSNYPVDTFYGLGPDLSDTFTPDASALPLLLEPTGRAVGMYYAPPDDMPYGRVVLLSFPLDALPAAGAAPDNRGEFLRRVLGFLAPNTIQVSNNLWQAQFQLTGPLALAGSGVSTLVTNAPTGQYIVHFLPVPFYQTPAPQTNSLILGGALSFRGNYTFADANSNGISDAWEQYYFGVVSPGRTATTDSDGDGFSDYAEFVAGTNPTNALSALVVTPTFDFSNAVIQLAWPVFSNRVYRVEATAANPGLLDGWTDVSGWMQFSTSPATFTWPLTNDTGYYRVQVLP